MPKTKWLPFPKPLTRTGCPGFVVLYAYYASGFHSALPVGGLSFFIYSIPLKRDSLKRLLGRIHWDFFLSSQSEGRRKPLDWSSSPLAILLIVTGRSSFQKFSLA